MGEKLNYPIHTRLSKENYLLLKQLSEHLDIPINTCARLLLNAKLFDVKTKGVSKIVIGLDTEFIKKK